MTITIDNPNQEFIIEVRFLKNSMDFNVNNEGWSFLNRRGRTDEELLKRLIKAYSEPQ